MSLIRNFRELVPFFYVQRVKGFVVSDEPWLDAETRAWFEMRLASSKRYIEFGSGGSTRLAGRLKIPTISVDCDAFFAAAVRKGLAQGHEVTLLDAAIGLTGPWGTPIFNKATNSRVSKWQTYIDLPFAELALQAADFPDFFMIDGRFRRACALQCARKAQLAGASADLLFDDYYTEGREHYSQVEKHLGAPERIGRSALFKIPSDTPVLEADVQAALRDYR